MHVLTTLAFLFFKLLFPQAMLKYLLLLVVCAFAQDIDMPAFDVILTQANTKVVHLSSQLSKLNKALQLVWLRCLQSIWACKMTQPTSSPSQRPLRLFVSQHGS